MDSLWRVLSVIKGGHGSQQKAKKVRDRVFATVEERWTAGQLEEQLPPGEAGWQKYIQKIVQGRRMGGPPEVEACAVGGGHRVTVYTEAKGGGGYRKIKKYGEENRERAGSLLMKKRMYAVMWEKEGEVGAGEAREEGNKEDGRWAPARAVGVDSDREQYVASSDSRPSRCGVGSVGSAAENDAEQKHRAAWAWQRR